MCMWYMCNIYGDFICTSMSFTHDFEGFWTFIFWHLGVHPMFMTYQDALRQKKNKKKNKYQISKPLTFVLKLKHGETFISFVISHTTIKQHALPSHVHKLFTFVNTQPNYASNHNSFSKQMITCKCIFSKNKQFAWRVNYGIKLKLGETKILNDAKRIKRYDYLLYWKFFYSPSRNIQPSISLFKLQV